MSQKYALPCSCGTQVAVEIRQAGDRAPCPNCAEMLDVPRLRELKTLEVIGPNAGSPARRESGAWHGLPGGLFAMGLLCLAISAASGWYTYSTRATFEEFTRPPAEEEIKFEFDIQEISLIDSWQAWSKFKDAKLASRQQPYHVFARQKVTSMNKWLSFFGVLATLGVLSMLASFVVRPR